MFDTSPWGGGKYRCTLVSSKWMPLRFNGPNVRNVGNRQQEPKTAGNSPKARQPRGDVNNFSSHPNKKSKLLFIPFQLGNALFLGPPRNKMAVFLFGPPLQHHKKGEPSERDVLVNLDISDKFNDPPPCGEGPCETGQCKRQGCVGVEGPQKVKSLSNQQLHENQLGSNRIWVCLRIG